MATAVPASKKQQALAPAGSSWDDNAIMKQILATHSPSGREFDIKSLLRIIKDLMQRASPAGSNLDGTRAELDALDSDMLHGDLSDMLDVLPFTINKISREISCKCSGGGDDRHTIAMSLFDTLSQHSWDAKAVIALAAFAANYGEFWLVAQLYPISPLAKPIAHLKQLPGKLDMDANTLHPRFESLNHLIKAMLDVTKCIVDFKEVPSDYTNPETPEIKTAMAYIPIGVYWTIRSIVACSSIITNLVVLGHEYIASTTEAWELSSLGHKLGNIQGQLSKQLKLCYQHINEKRHVEAFGTLVRLFNTSHLDNLEILKAMIYPKDYQQPLIHGSSHTRASIERLRKKPVLLLISDLDIPDEEVLCLDCCYKECVRPLNMSFDMEVLWLPVIDGANPLDEANQTKFERVQTIMPWYSLHHPSLLDPAAIKYIKEVWRFTKKPMVVALSPYGEVLNTNALHMSYIWGGSAFPFSSQREELLWREEDNSRMEFWVDSIDPTILQWVKEDKFVCLYGGEDIEWIRKFTTTAHTAAKALGIQFEMVYVGKSNPKATVRSNTRIITDEHLSHTLEDVAIWFFWARIESMWCSKMKVEKSVKNDRLVREITTMLSFDSGEQGWAVIGKDGPLSLTEMAKAKGDIIVRVFDEYNDWKDDCLYDGFLGALKNQILHFHAATHCNSLILPETTTDNSPDQVACFDCGREMEKFTLYRCCDN
ncbi:hypothetical protein RJ639_017489 [Escallonia herrerae]|uniref:Protein SIEVE ELEMENT OCCLUSION B-like n=1 Tax=Escallonia herrerae TaxID=1293975 RepID=A0AA88VD24_9ASTE|nr:hypothetical protein RJ639_017489 [Escallonia herrerae]